MSRDLDNVRGLRATGIGTTGTGSDNLCVTAVGNLVDVSPSHLCSIIELCVISDKLHEMTKLTSMQALSMMHPREQEDVGEFF